MNTEEATDLHNGLESEEEIRDFHNISESEEESEEESQEESEEESEEDIRELYNDLGFAIEDYTEEDIRDNYVYFIELPENAVEFQTFKDSVGGIDDCPTTKKEFLEYLLSILHSLSDNRISDIAKGLKNTMNFNEAKNAIIEKYISNYNTDEIRTYQEKRDYNNEMKEKIYYLQSEVILYLSKKMATDYKEVNNEIRYWKITDKDSGTRISITPIETFIEINYIDFDFFKIIFGWLLEYIYFGKVLSWMDPTLLHNEYKQMYFFWALKTDPNANQNEIVLTKENFYKYDITGLPDYGISQKQLLTYFIKEYIPKIKVLGKIELHLSDEKLFQFLKFSRFYEVNKSFYKYVIELVDKNVLIRLDILEKTAKNLANILLKERYPKNRYLDLNLKMDYLSKFIINLKTELLFTKLSLAKKMKSVVNRHTKIPHKRFKWQDLCSKVESRFNLDELRALAVTENIPNFLTKTKVELCGDFALKYTEMYDEQMKLVNSDKCNNKEFGTILGTELKDVPTEFFFTFTDNGQLYCTDIRDLNTQFSKDDFKNPWTRSNLPDIVVKNSQDFYNKLKESVNNFLDKDEPEVPKLSKSSELSTKISAVLSALRYPATAQKFIDADDSKIKDFSTDLVTNQVLTRTEERQVNSQLDSFTKKIVLLQILQTKINNDPLENGAPTTSFRGELEDSYNRNFSAGNENETETETES